MPPETVAARAHRSAKWVTDQVLRRSLQVRQLPREDKAPTVAAL
jgi:hypothetical protein